MSYLLMSKKFFEIPPEKFNGKIPFIVTDLIEEMKRRKVENIQGIFRLNGSDVRCRELIENLNNGRVTNFSKYSDINTLSTVLKRYFRKMSESGPLIPFSLYKKLISVMDDSSMSQEQQVNLIKPLLRSEMSECRLKILKYLCQFLTFISEHESENQMNIKNLAICIAPNIIVSQTQTDGAMKESGLVNNAFALILGKYESFLDGISINEDDIMTDEDFAVMTSSKFPVSTLQHLILRYKEREDSLIPYIPFCHFSENPKYIRPSKSPQLIDD